MGQQCHRVSGIFCILDWNKYPFLLLPLLLMLLVAVVTTKLEFVELLKRQKFCLAFLSLYFNIVEVFYILLYCLYILILYISNWLRSVYISGSQPGCLDVVLGVPPNFGFHCNLLGFLVKSSIIY
jgi:hypothetical protein